MKCITLLSDFGLRDASVASVKGFLLQQLPEVQVVDISHDVEPFHMQQAAYLLVSAFRNFPLGTCHLLLIDIFANKDNRMILAEHNGQYFICSDNGLLTIAFGNSTAKVWNCFESEQGITFKEWLGKAISIIAQLQNKLATELGLSACTLKSSVKNFSPVIEADYVECQVIHIDRYENVVINMTNEQFEAIGKGREFNIAFTRNEYIDKISRHFNDVPYGQKLCRFNAAGYLEIAINGGNAAGLFGFKLSGSSTIYHTIKIHFK
jgi:S-adenosyl-L-methionine hydrolase (adenosine-forming)